MADVKITELPEIAEVSGTDVLPIVDVSGSVTSKVTFTDLRTAVLDGVSADKIEDAAGTTRVETEEETGHVTTTADGHRVIDAGRYETTIETDTSDVLGEGTLVASKLHLLNHEGGLGVRLGVEASVEYSGEEPYTFDIFSGVSSKIEGASLGTWGGAIGGPITSKTTIVVGQGTAAFEHAEPGENPNDPPTITRVPVWDETAPGPLPEGMDSIVHGFHVLDARAPQPWAPSWTGSLNVDSVSHVEASFKDEGDYIDLECGLTMTPTGIGSCEMSAAIGGAFAHPENIRICTTTSTEGSYAVAGVMTDGTIFLEVEAASAGAHLITIQVRYRKALP